MSGTPRERQIQAESFASVRLPSHAADGRQAARSLKASAFRNRYPQDHANGTGSQQRCRRPLSNEDADLVGRDAISSDQSGDQLRPDGGGFTPTGAADVGHIPSTADLVMGRTRLGTRITPLCRSLGPFPHVLSQCRLEDAS